MKNLATYSVLAAVTLVCLVNAGQAATDPTLIGHWTMDGDVLDTSGYGNDGTIVGNEQYVAGMIGQAINLDGSTHIDCGNPAAFTLTDQVTMAIWMNNPGFTKSWELLMGKGSATYRMQRNTATSTLEFGMNGPVGGYFYGTIAVDDGEWHHIACSYDSAMATIYVDGEVDVSLARTGSFATTTSNFLIGENSGDTGRQFGGLLDDAQLYNRGLSQDEIKSIMKGLTNPGNASSPVPEDGIDDVLRDGVLSWAPGKYPGTHNVYFGSSFDDVNSATTPTASGLDAVSFDPGRLDFGQTYFWRVDEVNATPDKTLFKGAVWSFTAEPYSIQIPGDTIAVTASSVSNEFSIPENTINGSGLGANDTHAMASETMWFTGVVDLDPWIQYEFDAVKKLDAMKVWNSNSAAEMAIGWGVKDVEIVYSVDGENWDVLEGPTQFSRAPGSPTYNQYDEIAFDGVAAKFVRFNIASNWGGILMSYSLAEVQFNMIPAAARTPEPADGSTDVVPNAIASWRAGREAAQSTLYVGIDPNEVADGLAPSLTSSTHSVDLRPLDLDLSTTYYWRVDEVNEAEAVSVWTGPVWSFATAAALIVDDFESYNNISPNRPFQAWLDGFGYSPDEFFPVAYPGNGTGAGIGHDIWSLSSPYYDGDIMETSITLPGSGKSMPFYYINSGGVASETERTFAVPQDWTVAGATILSIPFQGAADNTGTLYVKINGVKVTYPRDPSNITLSGWQAFNINLASVSTNLQNVTKLAIGVDGSGATGMILIDDITLHSEAGEIITPEDPGTNGLFAQYSFEGNANDVSGHGHNGTLVGSAALISDATRGQVLSLDGLGSCVDLGPSGEPTQDFNFGGSFSLCAWVNITDFTAAWSDVIVGNRGEGNLGWQLRRWNDSSNLTFTVRNTTGLDDPQGNVNVLDMAGQWIQVTAVYDVEAGMRSLYVNGLLDVEIADNGACGASTHRVYIGARADSGNTGPEAFFNGMIDDVRMYNRALSAGEALSLAGRTTPIDKPF